MSFWRLGHVTSSAGSYSFLYLVIVGTQPNILAGLSLCLTSRPQNFLCLHQGGGGEARTHTLGQQDAIRGDVV